MKIGVDFSYISKHSGGTAWVSKLVLPLYITFLTAAAEAIVPLILSELYAAPNLFVITGLIFEENILSAFKYSTARMLFEVLKISEFFPVTALKAEARAEGKDIPLESSDLRISLKVSVGFMKSSAAADSADKSVVSAPKARLSAIPEDDIIFIAPRAKFSADAVEYTTGSSITISAPPRRVALVLAHLS